MATPVSSIERDEYFKSVFDILQKIGRPLPSVLWHYTTGTSLIKIIASSEIWATHISCLNDHRELRLSSALLSEALERYAKANALSPDDQVLLDEAVKGLAGDTGHTSWWFVACFSEAKDDLSQWRAYGSGEGGYAIGFNAQELSRICASDKSYIAPVQYDPDIQTSVADEVASQTFTYFRKGRHLRSTEAVDEWVQTFLQAWAAATTFLGPIAKHRAFGGEREWRIVRQLRPDDFPRMKYIQRESMMSRHLPLRIGGPFVGSAGKKLMPIAEIMVGPNRHKEVSRVSVGDLMRTFDYPDDKRNVTLSEVPFQKI